MVTLSLLLAFFSVQPVSAVPLANFLGAGESAYFQMILPRFFHWYEAKNGIIQNRLTKTESEYIEYCFAHIHDWANSQDPHKLWNHFRVVATQENDKLYTKKISIGPSEWDKHSLSLVKTILEKRKIQAPRALQDLFWLEWDLDKDIFSLYYMDKLENAKLANQKEFEEFALVKFAYSKGIHQSLPVWFVERKKVKNGVWNAFQPLVTDEAEIFENGQWKGTIYETLAFDVRFVAEPLRSLARDIFSEFRFISDSFQFKDEKNVEVFYP